MRSIREFGLLFAIALPLGGCPALCEAPPARTVDELVDRTLGELVRDQKVVGGVAGVIRDGVVTRHFLGEVAEGSGVAPAAGTLYEIGSISKTFTGALLALMAAEGTVALDQPVEELLPPGTTAPEFDGRKITLRDLATQSSGLPRLPDNLRPANPQDPYADYSMADLYAFLAGHRLRRAPGAEYEYSNFGFALLGQALALKSGIAYERLLSERVFAPLGMTESTFSLSEAQQPRLAPPYAEPGLCWWDCSPVPDHAWNLGVFNPAGGIRSTLDDMLAYLRAAMGAAADPPAGALAGAAIMLDPSFRVNEGLSVALGWHVLTNVSSRRETVWHNGQTGGYHAFLAFHRGTQNGVVFLANTAADIDAPAFALLDGLDALPR